MRTYIICALTLLALLSCGGGTNASTTEPDIPITPGGGGSKEEKPKAMWIDAHANFSRFSTKESVKSYLEKTKAAGFNMVYLDVKPGIGYALYESDILPKLTKWDTEEVNRDWDYLGYWIEEAEKLKIDVVASISTLGYGYTRKKEGLVYSDKKWDGKTQFYMPEDGTGNILDIRDNDKVDAALLDPSVPEVQEFVINVVTEIAKKYPKLKGLSLDYCRWYGGSYGLGPSSLKAFNAYTSLNVSDVSEILGKNMAPGKYYNKWIEFRAMTITNLITNIKEKVKALNPKMEIHLWASADWGSRYSVGQNWASKKYQPGASFIYTTDYNKTGFADQLDVFILGAYADAVWKKDNPGSVWSVENFVNTYNKYVMDDCKVYGSITSYAYKAEGMSDAVYLCLKQTDGLMVFDISHVINNGMWEAIKEGIERGEK